jgi:hypothetical protein
MIWGHLIDDRPDEGVFRVHRDAFRDPAVFAQEIVQFFERGWVNCWAAWIPASKRTMCWFFCS